MRPGYLSTEEKKPWNQLDNRLHESQSGPGGGGRETSERSGFILQVEHLSSLLSCVIEISALPFICYSFTWKWLMLVIGRNLML
jgi:hypothetical protein